VSNESFDVFLSHNSRDKPAVRHLAGQLKDIGIKVWLDEEQLVPGRPWQEALEQVVCTAKSAAVLVGKDGMGPWQDREMRSCLSQFVKRQLPVIPVLLPGAPSEPDLPIFLSELTWVDLRGGLTDEGLERLKWGITNVASPVLPTPPPSLFTRLRRYITRPRNLAISMLLLFLAAMAIYSAMPSTPEFKQISFAQFVADINSLRDDSLGASKGETRLLKYLEDNHLLGAQVQWQCEIIRVNAEMKNYKVGTTKDARLRDQALADFSVSGGFIAEPGSGTKTIEGVISAVNRLGIILKDCRFVENQSEQ
jgi:hypothetical protein